ncbi:MAG: DUF1348 family protein [Kofleriaceae bacterium]
MSSPTPFGATSGTSVEQRVPLPPFDASSAARKARLAEDVWNSRDPARVALAYSMDSRWRNRSELFTGRAAIQAFLENKWQHEREYRLIKEVWAWSGARVAVRFVYECHDLEGRWKRAHGNEQWEFDANGLMCRREASINDIAITADERCFHWALGRRPDDHPGLTELGM